MKRLTKLSATMLAITVSTVTLIGAESLTASPVFANTYSTSVQASITQLSNEISGLSALANSKTGSSLTGNVLTVIRTPGFDWNEVMFGTDSLSSTQSATSEKLAADVQQLLTLQSSDAASLVESIIESMQSLNPSIQPQDVVAFLQDIVGSAYSEMISLKTLNPLTASTAAAQMHQAFAEYLASPSTSAAIQALFGVSNGGGLAGGGGVGTGGSADSVTVPTGTGSAFTTVLGTVQVDGSAATFQETAGSASIQLSVPTGAFSTPESITLTSGTPADAAGVFQGTSYSKFSPIITFGVNFSGGVPAVPVSLTLTLPTLPANAQVFKVNADGSLMTVPATNQDGVVTVTFTSDPDFIIAAPPQALVTTPKPVPSWPGYLTKSIQLDGKSLYEVPSLVAHGTTYMPIWYVMQMLDDIGFKNTWNGHDWKLTAPPGVTPDYSALTIDTGSGIYLNGTLIERVPSMVAVDPTSHHKTTYMPIWYVMRALNRAHVTNTWSSSAWSISSMTNRK